MSFNVTYNESGKRDAFRASLPGLFVRIDGETFCKVNDLSASGIGFTPPSEGVIFADGHPLEQNEDFVLDLLIGNKVVMELLGVLAVRIKKDLIACTFINMDRLQEERLDKIVLEIQKHIIMRRKAEETT